MNSLHASFVDRVNLVFNRSQNETFTMSRVELFVILLVTLVFVESKSLTQSEKTIRFAAIVS